jgi:hypothetical protein
MNRRTLIFLFVTAVVLIAISLLMPSPVEKNGSEELLIPGLKEKLNDVTRLSISAAGNRPVATLERGESQWTLIERSGHPADVGKIRRNLIALGDATIVEEKTSDPALYDRLGIEDIDDSEAGGVKLDIYWPGQNEDTPVSLIVGDTGIRGKMAYVRLTGEARGLMVSADVDLGGDTMDWLARELVDIPTGDLHAVTINHPDGEVLRIEKPSRDEQDFAVMNIPDGKELLYPSVANTLGELLVKLSFEDVASAKDAGLNDSEPVRVRFDTFDGLVIGAEAYSTDDGIRVRFHAQADEALWNRFLPASEAGSGEDADPPRDPARFDAIVEQAEDLDARLSPWVYTLPSFKSDQLVKHLNDLLQTEDE